VPVKYQIHLKVIPIFLGIYIVHHSFLQYTVQFHMNMKKLFSIHEMSNVFFCD
jgi:hypothetical protein